MPSTKSITMGNERLEMAFEFQDLYSVNEKSRNIRGMCEFTCSSIDTRIREANDCYYTDGTLEDINDKIDEPFYKRFDNKSGILERENRYECK